MDLTAVLGHWQVPGAAFSFLAAGDEVLVIHPGCPAGYEPRLVAAGEHGARVIGGPFNGGVIEFDVGKGGRVVRGRIGGLIPVDRVDAAPAEEPGSGLLPPPTSEETSDHVEFGRMLDEILRAGDGRLVDYTLDSPKHAFVRYVMGRDVAIFHGSNRHDIDEFLPLRESVELEDHGGSGNVGGVYGTHDGLWAMFFAVVDRARLVGSIRNGVTTYTSPSGDQQDVYNFSIHHEMLAKRPYTHGMLYLMPRNRFERMPHYPGGPLSNEWVCRTPVRPLARLLVEPDDFPFLEEIGGHDDSELLAFWQLAGVVYDGAISADRIEGGIRVVTSVPRATVDRFIEASRRWFPGVERDASDSEDGTVLDSRGPGAFLQSLEKRLESLL